MQIEEENELKKEVDVSSVGRSDRAMQCFRQVLVVRKKTLCGHLKRIKESRRQEKKKERGAKEVDSMRWDQEPRVTKWLRSLPCWQRGCGREEGEGAAEEVEGKV